MVGEDHFHFRAAGLHQLFVIVNIIHTGEFMNRGTEQLTVFIQRQHIRIGIDPQQLDVVQLDKMTSYDVMYKTMASCGFSGYGNVRFAVLQRNAE